MRLLLLPICVSKLAGLTTWEPFELSFEASESHNGYAFPVEVEFVHEDPAESKLTVKAFWDGGRTWKARAVLPEPGRWTWKSVSDDSGMNAIDGTLDVSEPGAVQVEANPNLRGSLRISESGRYFEYADGTPVFLLANTLWGGNTARCGLGENESGPFFQHLFDRKAKGFNTMLMQYFHGYGDYPDSPGHRNEGGKPYLDIETKELNPAFFHYLDQRMEALWREGFIVAIPTTWWGKTKNCVFTPEDAERISAYCAVRYGAYNSIWSISGEYQYAFDDCGWTEADFNRIGRVVQQHNPFGRPLSIHPSGRTNWDPPHNTQSSLPFHDQPWLDHHWLQTGQSRDRLHNMVSRSVETRLARPATPVFLSEAYYERSFDAEGAYTSRWQVWTSLVQGTCGFGYGTFGIWQFYDPDDPRGETGKHANQVVPWWDAFDLPGSREVGPVHSALGQLDWWKLEPATNKIRVDGNPGVSPSAEDISPPQAARIGDQAWILYIPRGNAGKRIQLLDTSKGDWTGSWINPRTGARFSSASVSVQGRQLRLPDLPKPQNEDWVFLAKAK